MRAKQINSEHETAQLLQELSQTSSELLRHKAELREEKRRNEKLQLTLDIEKEANAQAQRIIEGIRNLDTSDVSDVDRSAARNRSVRDMSTVCAVCACTGLRSSV